MTQTFPSPKDGPAPHLRGLILVIFMYGWMALMGLACLPYVLVSPRAGAIWSVRNYCRIVRVATRLICGLRTEIRGPVPRGEALIAAKHQSFLDIIMLVSVLPAPRFVMKRSLLWAPVLGWYARKIGCVAVERGAKGKALKGMVQETASDKVPGQLVIYPQGTRVAPGAKVSYKIGVAALADALEAPVIPVAVNGGLFWPRSGILRRPGLAVVEFLPEIPSGLPRAELMARLETQIETASDRLMEEALG